MRNTRRNGNLDRLTCTLDHDALGSRVDRWRTVLAHATRRTDGAAGTSVTFPADPAVTSELVALIAAQRLCCAFLSFTMSWVGTDVVLHVSGPPHDRELVDTLFPRG